jgi:sortase A
MRRGLRGLSTVLILVGVLLLADVAVTLAWQEPLSALYSKLTQDALADDLHTLEAAPPTAAEQRALARLRDDKAKAAFLARSLRRRTEDGDAIGRISMPTIDASWVFVEGTGGSDLRKGPGHYPATAFPGLPGTVAIAGHRTTYAAPFRDLDKLDPGDEIRLRMPYGDFFYEVERTRVVAPDAIWVTRSVGYERLVLSACHPKYSAAKRIVAFARLERTVLRRGARSR